MSIPLRAARTAGAVLALVLLAGCTDSSGGNGRQAAGSGPTGGTSTAATAGSTRPVTSAPPSPSSAVPTSAAPTTAAPETPSTISPNLGVIAITIASSDKVLMTPEGMALGWTVAQVHAAYPSFPLDAESRPTGPPTIPVPQNAQAVYRIRLSAGVVVTMTLESFPQDCYG